MKINKTLLILALMIFTSCGYKPSSHLIKNIFTDKIFVQVNIDKAEPENAPFVKDEIHRLVYSRFKSRVTNKEEATSQIIVSYAGSTFYPLAYKDGYVVRYMANIRVKFIMITKKGKISKSISARVEADIPPSSLTSSTLRTEAIRKGVEKALDEFLAYVSVKGIINK